MITVLPLDAEVIIVTRNSQGQKVSAKLDNIGFISHPVNGTLNPTAVYQHNLLLPTRLLEADKLLVKVPISSSGSIFIASKGTIPQRVAYQANSKGRSEELKLTMAEAGSITGIVRDPSGKPLANVDILAQWNHQSNTDLLLENGTWGHCKSDADGRYLITGLDPRVKFNVMLMREYERMNQSPLHLKALEAVAVNADNPVNLDLQLEPARLVKGVVVDKKTGKPTIVLVGYSGAARPESSGASLHTKTNQQGEFSVWLPSGKAVLYCADQQIQGSVKTVVPADRELPSVKIESTSQKPNTIAGKPSVVAYTGQNVDQTKAVQAFPGIGTTVGSPQYLQNVELESATPLPAELRYRLYIEKNPDDFEPTSSQLRIAAISSNVLAFRIPQLEGKKLVLELDAEGFESARHTFPAKQVDLLRIKMNASKYVPVKCLVTSNQQPASLARVQVELQRLGSVVDSPWGPILLSDDAGKCTIEHLRPSDIFRLRVWGQDGSSAVTNWQQATVGTTLQVTLSGK